MRAAEFMRALADVIDALDGGSSVNDGSFRDPSELDQNPVMVPPLQQQIELDKAAVGKISPIIKKLTQNETELDPTNPVYKNSIKPAKNQHKLTRIKIKGLTNSRKKPVKNKPKTSKKPVKNQPKTGKK